MMTGGCQKDIGDVMNKGSSAIVLLFLCVRISSQERKPIAKKESRRRLQKFSAFRGIDLGAAYSLAGSASRKEDRFPEPDLSSVIMHTKVRDASSQIRFLQLTLLLGSSITTQ